MKDDDDIIDYNFEVGKGGTADGTKRKSGEKSNVSEDDDEMDDKKVEEDEDDDMYEYDEEDIDEDDGEDWGKSGADFDTDKANL